MSDDIVGAEAIMYRMSDDGVGAEAIMRGEEILYIYFVFLVYFYQEYQVKQQQPQMVVWNIAKYNELETQDESQEETGWKLVYGDVFRAPPHATLFCVQVALGEKLFAMTLVTMIFAFLGFLSPANRVGLMTTMFLIWLNVVCLQKHEKSW